MPRDPPFPASETFSSPRRTTPIEYANLLPRSLIMKNHPAFFHLLSALALSGAIASAQTPPTTAPASAPSATAAPSELKIILMDGSVVSGKLSVADLAIDTKFGSLKVPVDQIQSLVPGLQSHPQFAASLEATINSLASDAFAEREKAQAALLKMGPEIKSILEHEAKSSQNEKQMRLQKILEEFETQLGDDDTVKVRQWTTGDVIVTPDFTVVGRITTPGFSVTSPYGTLQLKFNDIREARRDEPQREDINKTIAVSGANQSGRASTPTTVRVARGDQVTITATGTNTLAPRGNQISTPEGNTDIGTSSTAGFPIGTLYARIGDSGAPLKVGNKVTFTASAAGVINLGIASPNGNFTFPGEYQAKIHVVKK
jgi:hypothetical protein